jgi:hypothetical protein
MPLLVGLSTTLAGPISAKAGPKRLCAVKALKTRKKNFSLGRNRGKFSARAAKSAEAGR